MTAELKTIIVTVDDLAASKAAYAALFGTDPASDEAYYVYFDVAGIHFGLAPKHGDAATGAVNFWHVDDIEATREALLATGATDRDPIREVGPGRRTTVLIDPEGNPIGLLQDS